MRPQGLEQFIAKSICSLGLLILGVACYCQNPVLNFVNSSTCVSCDGQAEVSVDPGEWTFNWLDENGVVVFSETSDTGISTLTSACAGIYSLSITNVLGESADLNFSIASNATALAPLASAAICSTDPNFNLSFYLNVSGAPGSWFNPLGNPVGGVINPPTALEGIYSYQVDEGGCTFSSGVDLTIYEQANPGLTTTYLICEDYEPFFMTNLLAGSPDPGGTWYAAGAVEMDGWFYPATMNSALFTYLFDTVPECPSIWTTMFVSENYLPDPGLDAELLVCPNAVPFDMTGFLGGTPELTGQWVTQFNVPISNVFDPQVNGAGTFTYIVSGNSPCPNLESELTISFTAGIDAGDDTALDLCAEFGSVNLLPLLDGSPMDGGIWTDPQGNVIDGTIDPEFDGPGEYTYTVDAVGCQPVSAVLDLDIEISPYSGPNQNIHLCELEGSTSLNDLLPANATPGGQWLDINNAPVNPLITLDPGTTTYYYYHVNGTTCPDSWAQIGIFVDTTVDAGPDVDLTFCETDGWIDLQTEVPPLTNYQWLDELGNPTSQVVNAADAIPIDLTYVALSLNACPNDDASVSAVFETLAFPDGMEADDICSDQLSVDLQPYISSLPVGGLWYDSADQVVGSDIDGALLPGEFYYVIDNGMACPPSIQQISLDQIQLPSAGDDMLLERCFDEGVLNLTDQLIGASSLAGTWYVNGAEVAGLVDLASSPGGVYTYQLDPLGPCPASESYLDLYIDQGVVFEAGFDASACSGSAVVELGQPPVGNLIYQWEPATNLSDITISNPEVNFENLTNELTEIDYVATVSNGICTIQDTVSVTIYPLPEPNLGPDLAICRWDEVDLFTGADGDHIWSPAFLFSDPNADLQALEIINDLAIGVQVTNEFGCVAADDMIISMLERPTGDFDVNPIEGCAPLVVEVENLSDNSMPVEYFWTLSNGTTSTDISPTFTFYAEGQHDISLLTVADNGCSSLQEATTFITVHPTPFASFYTVSEELSVLHSNLDVHNTSLGGYEYNWSINGLLASTDFEPTLFLPEVPDQDYWICLETINEFGCSDSTCHPVHVVGEFTLYAPNAFTPDQDGINEAFQVYVAGADMSTFELSIYNRWGEQLFISTNPNEPWYGNTFGGDYFVPNGVYVWQVRIQSLYSAELITERGTVTLIR